MVSFIMNGEEVVAWADTYVDWTDSSQKYYGEAKEWGIINDLT